MYLLRLALASLNNRRFTALLTVFAIALSVCLLLAVERVRTEARASFASTISGTTIHTQQRLPRCFKACEMTTSSGKRQPHRSICCG